MQFYTLSDCGKRRENNEDFCAAENIKGYDVMMLADGMGGAASGEVASQSAVKTAMLHIRENLKENFEPAQILSVMKEALSRANSEILKLSIQNDEYNGMGTTADICIVDKNTVYTAHIGDSRIYKISEDKISMLTRDHTLMDYLISTGAITPREALTHPQRHMITRALGTVEIIDVDTSISEIKEKDVLLLCSDGLTNMLSDSEIASIIRKSQSPAQAAETLVRRANEEGGNDNITVVVAQK